MKRAPEIGAVALLIATLVVWMAALVTARPPKMPSVVVLGEPLMPAGAPRAFRISAAMPNASARSTVTGTVRVGSERADVVDGTARVVSARADVPTTIDLVVDGAIDVHATARQEPTSMRLGPPRLTYDDWHAEIQFAGPPVEGHERSKAPIYPIDGRASARLKGRAFLLDEITDEPHAFDLDPAMTGARVDDGRVLRIDRSGLRIDAPLECDANAPLHVTIETGEKRDVGLDLLVDGAVHDTRNVVVDGKQDVTLLVGDARPGDVVVVHAGGVWSDDLGRAVVLRVRDPHKPLVQWIDETTARAGALAGEPLLHWLKAHPDDVDVAHAVLNRLRPAKLRAPKLELTIAAERETGRDFALAYAICAALTVVVVAGVGVVRAPKRRALAVVGALALALMLAGLGGVLVVLARA